MELFALEKGAKIFVGEVLAIVVAHGVMNSCLEFAKVKECSFEIFTVEFDAWITKVVLTYVPELGNKLYITFRIEDLYQLANDALRFVTHNAIVIAIEGARTYVTVCDYGKFHGSSLGRF